MFRLAAGVHLFQRELGGLQGPRQAAGDDQVDSRLAEGLARADGLVSALFVQRNLAGLVGVSRGVEVADLSMAKQVDSPARVDHFFKLG